MDLPDFVIRKSLQSREDFAELLHHARACQRKFDACLRRYVNYLAGAKSIDMVSATHMPLFLRG